MHNIKLILKNKKKMANATLVGEGHSEAKGGVKFELVGIPDVMMEQPEKKKKVSEEEASPVIDKKENDFSDDDLQKAWKAFAEQKKDAGDTERLVLSKSVKKGENHSVVLMLGSQLEVSFLEKFDTEVVQFLRSELQNDHIVIRTEITEIESEKKLYTSTDIFDYMVKQNPDLKDLKDRLGLDFDYQF